jgi:sRNA-binding protein
MSTKVLALLILFFTSAAFAEDFKTVNGKEYKDATVTRVEPDGIVVKTNSGVTKVYFVELPKDVQERFHYDSEKAASYSAEQAANYTAYQKQQDETQRQQQAADAKNKAVLSNNKEPRITLRPCRSATTNFRSRKMICFSRSVKRSNPGRPIAVARTAGRCSTSQIRKNHNCQFSKAI